MAHCDEKMSNHVRLVPPNSSDVAIVSHDALPAGKGNGLGCSSNSQFVACTFQDPNGNNLIFYDARGNRTWAAGSLLNASAYASAPLINEDGDVIAADTVHVVRLKSDGTVVWDTATPGGIPISPVVTASGTVVLATYGGPVSAFDSSTGKPLGSLLLPGPSRTANFDTINTPCVHGNRIYISMQLEDAAHDVGALVAMDVDASNPTTPLSVAWKFSFGAPGGASPLCVANTVYFDGASRYPGQSSAPQIFALQDSGTSPTLMWNTKVPNKLPANLGLDPRGGMWAMFEGDPKMKRFDAQTGRLMQNLDIGALVGGTDLNYPYSAISIAGTRSDPVMLLGTRNHAITSSHVIAVDLPSQTLLWSLELAPLYPNDDAAAQFPIVEDENGKPVVVFAGRKSGAYFVAVPQPMH